MKKLDKEGKVATADGASGPCIYKVDKYANLDLEAES